MHIKAPDRGHVAGRGSRVAWRRLAGRILALLDDGGGRVDIAPWCDRIDASTGPEMDAGLVRLAAHGASHVSWGEDDSWWWYPPDPVALARDRLCSPVVQQRLTAFAARNPKCKNAADALAGIRSLAVGEHSPWLHPRSPGPGRFIVWR